MPQDISVQILSQTSESIQKLYDLSTRIDERVKSIQEKQHNLEQKIAEAQKAHTEIMQRLAVLESKNGDAALAKLDEMDESLNSLDRRVIHVESATGQSKDRWNKIFTFIIQIIWVILAAWLLMKLGIQAPAVP